MLPNPLTADEIAAWRDIAVDEQLRAWQPMAVLRLIATIEQQREQIEKLRAALEKCSQRSRRRIGNER